MTSMLTMAATWPFDGGSIGRNFETVGASVTISGGAIDSGFTALEGSTVNIAGGVVQGGAQECWGRFRCSFTSQPFRAFGGSNVNIDGGTVGDFSEAHDGATVNLSTGQIGDRFHAIGGAALNISGGRIGDHFYGEESSRVSLSGGTFGRRFFAEGELTVVGGQFRVNGLLVDAFANGGDSAQIELPKGAILSGTLADGTPFALSRDHRTGPVMLEAVILPPISSELTASRIQIPTGVREGQTLQVDNGSAVPDDFRAGWGSIVNIDQGGSVGASFEAVGAMVRVAGGTIGDDFSALAEAQVELTEGTIGVFLPS